MMMGSAIGLTTYGDAQILKGYLTIVRDGQATNFTAADGDIPVLVGDVLRVGKSSRVILNTVEDTAIRMGSHSVFQVKPWQKRKKTGYARMVYGKMRFATKKLQGKRRFRLKTATATIGVKGTKGETEVSSNGNTSCKGIEDTISFQGNSGESRDLNPNQLAMAVGNKPVRDPVDLPPGQQPSDEEPGEDQADEDLDKAPPTSSDSSSLDSEGVALETGLIEEGELEESKEEEVSGDASLEEEQKQEEQNQQIDQKEEVEQDPEFEQDLEQSEENLELASVEPDVPAETPDFGTGGLDEGVDDGQDEPDEPAIAPPEVEPEVDPDSLKGIGRLKPVF